MRGAGGNSGPYRDRLFSSAQSSPDAYTSFPFAAKAETFIIQDSVMDELDVPTLTKPEYAPAQKQLVSGAPSAL